MRELIIIEFLNRPSVILDRIASLADALNEHFIVSDHEWLKKAIEAHMTGNEIPEIETP